MRVLFAGTTGLSKSDAINKVLRKALSKTGKPSDPENVHSLKFIRHFDFEKELSKKFGFPLWTFFKSMYATEQVREWNGTFDSILQKIETEQTENVFLSLHTTFFSDSRFFSLVDQDLVKQFNPDLFVTFIDDSYAVWQRIVDKSETAEDPAKSYLRLRDIMAWRTVEILVTDMIAKNLGKKNYVVAVKHPTQMLFNMIFAPQIPFFYASFPISSTRKSPKLIKEVNDFREKMHSKYVVFDPLTIDEKIMQSLMRTRAKSKSGAKKQKSTSGLSGDFRWKFPPDFSMVGEETLKFPIQLKKNEVEEIAEDIDENVQYRDYRLISDSDALIAYRPWLGKSVHEGVRSELQFADAISKPSLMYFPQEDKEEERSAFGTNAIPYEHLDEFYVAIANFKPPEGVRNWRGFTHS